MRGAAAQQGAAAAAGAWAALTQQRETVRAALDDEAFDAVRLALAAVKHGPLAAYTFEKDELVVVAEEAPAAAEAEADGFELVAAA